MICTGPSGSSLYLPAVRAHELRQHNAFTTIKALIFVSALTAPQIYSRFFSTGSRSSSFIARRTVIRMVELAALSKPEEAGFSGSAKTCG